MVLFMKFNNDSSVGEDYGETSVIVDYSTKENNGTNHTSLIYNSTGGYLGDGAFVFGNANADAITVLDDNTLEPQDFTISGWIYPLNDGGGNFGRVLSKDENDGIVISMVSDNLRMTVNGTNGNTIDTIDNTWNFFTFTKKGTELLSYLNGVLVRNDTVPATLGYGVGNLTIGNRESDFSRGFNGTIDSLIIYNETLTQKEIWELYYTYYGCLIPSENLDIYGDTVLCNGDYYLNDTDQDGVIRVLSDNVTINGNGSNFIGNGSSISTGIAIISKNNITIKDFNFQDYDIPIKMDKSNSITLDNNTYLNFNRVLVMQSKYVNIVNSSFLNASNVKLSSTEGAIYIYNYTSTNSPSSNIIISDNFFSGTSKRHIYGETIEDLSITKNEFDLTTNGGSIYLTKNIWNVNISDNSFSNYNLSFYAVSFFNLLGTNNFLSNNTYDARAFFGRNIANLSFSMETITDAPYYVYSIENSSNIIMDSIRATDILQLGIFMSVQNFTMKNSFSENVSGLGVLDFRDYSEDIYILNNSVNYVSEFVQLWKVSNVRIINNSINATINNHDGWNIGISLLADVNDTIVMGNNLTNVGNAGIVFKKSNNISIFSNYISFYPIGNKIGSVDDGNEPLCAIQGVELYKSYLADGTDNANNTYANISKYRSTNINISDNSFESVNTQCYLRTQGTINLSHDISSYKLFSWQLPYYLDRDDLYLRTDLKNLSNVYSDYQLRYNFTQAVSGFFISSRVKEVYSWDREFIYFSNYNDSGNQTNIYNQTNSLFHNGTSICNGSSSNINSNDNNINITLNPSEECYVLDNYNVTEGYTRSNDPIWISSSTDYLKHVASNLSDTINVTVSFNVQSCGNLGNIHQYLNGVLVKTYYSGLFSDYSCSNNVVTFTSEIYQSSESNEFEFSYECTPLTRVGLRLVAIFSALLIPLYFIYTFNKKGWENIGLEEIIILFVAVAIGMGLILASWQNLGSVCGSLAT